MRKRKYRLHYGDYAPEENERLYMDMSKKGWRLTKRGIFFSRFVRTEPEDLLYRIDFSAPDVFGDASLPREQIAVYEECGLHLVTRQGLVHVFCAQKDSGIGELYTDPRQRAATLRTLRKNTIFSLIQCILFLLLYLLLFFWTGGGDSSFAEWGAQLRKEWIDNTAFWLGFCLILAEGVLSSGYAAYRTSRLYWILKHNRSLRRRITRHWLKRSVCGLLGICGAVSLIFAGIQFFGVQRYDMPVTADGPYLLIADLDIDGKRAANHQGTVSHVEMNRSLLAAHWETYEYIQTADGDRWLYNSVYELEKEQSAVSLTKDLMYGAFAQNPSAWTAVSIAGLDEAYTDGTGLEYLARKGTRVWRLIYGGWSDHNAPEEQILSALAEISVIR